MEVSPVAITTNIEKTTRTAQEIAEAQRKAFEALTDNRGSAGRRNAEFTRGFTDFLKLQESNAKMAQGLFASGVKFAEL